MRYSSHLNPSNTPQSEPLPDRPEQVKNSAGGFVFPVTPLKQAERFLILGNEGGTYYANERKMTLDNAACIKRVARTPGDNDVLVDMIVDISTSGRAPKVDPAIFALAVCIKETPVGSDARAASYDAIREVCRIGTHLFQLMQALKDLDVKWGGGLRHGVERFYRREGQDLAYQLEKYRQRDGWTHRDVLRLCHARPSNADDRLLLSRAAGKPADPEVERYASEGLRKWIDAVDAISHEENPGRAAAIIDKYRLPREVVPTELLNSKLVWEALVQHMPLWATVRSLGKLSSMKMLDPGTATLKTVRDRIEDDAYVVKSRLHPLTTLTALRTYEKGKGDKGKLSWTPSAPIASALEKAFYAGFGAVTPIGKPVCLALDVSGSMGAGAIAGSPITPREATAALALVHASTEKDYAIMGFSQRFVPLNIHKGMSLSQATRAVSDLPFEGTDCAFPMVWALNEKYLFDGFVVLTDNETWAGRIHPNVALQKYRKDSGRDAKLAVVGMTATKFSIADPTDAGMMDVVGFDTATPNLISDFIRA